MKPYLDIQEACVLANVSRWTISRWIKAGLIRAVKVGRSIRIKAESLRAFLDAQQTDTMKAQS